MARRKLRRRRRADEVETRELVLDEAERLIGAGGYDALRLKDIAEAVGIRIPSIYGHYEGRAGVLRGIAQRYVVLLADQFPYDGDTDPTKVLVEGVRKFVHMWAAHPAYTRMRLRDLEAPAGIPELDWAVAGPAEENAKHGPLAPFFARLQRILDDGYEQGHFRRMGFIRLYRDILGATLGALTYPNQRVLQGKASTAEVEEIAREIEDLVLRLVRPD